VQRKYFRKIFAVSTISIP